MVDGVTADDDGVAPIYKLMEICEVLRASDAGVVREVADFVLKRSTARAPSSSRRCVRVRCAHHHLPDSLLRSLA
jgi:ribonuclease Z